VDGPDFLPEGNFLTGGTTAGGDCFTDEEWWLLRSSRDCAAVVRRIRSGDEKSGGSLDEVDAEVTGSTAFLGREPAFEDVAAATGGGFTGLGTFRAGDVGSLDEVDAEVTGSTAFLGREPAFEDVAAATGGGFTGLGTFRAGDVTRG
jgi:hypothetical protein